MSIGFVIGLPGENDDTIEQNYKIAKQIDPYRLQFSSWVPLPNSPLVEKGYGDHNIKSFHKIDNKNKKVNDWVQYL